MTSRCAGLLLAALVLASGAFAGPARAQAPQARLDSARALVRLGEYDSATAVLNPVFQDVRTTPAQRSRAFLISAAVIFASENFAISNQSRQRLQFALQADSTVRVDDDLETDVPGMRAQVEALRRELYPPARVVAGPTVVPLTVQPAMLSDTTLPAADGHFPIAPHPSRRARAFVTIVRADAPGVVIWSDTLEAADSAGSLAWDLRGRDGALVSPGPYAVQAWAVDQAGERSPTVERVLRISRVPVDTQPVPAPLSQSAFAPETLHIKRGSPLGILVGAGLGAAAAFMPAALGRPELNQGLAGDGTAYAVAGAVALAGIVGFLAGERVSYSPENARRNVELRDQHRTRVATITAANARARDSAPIRVTLERSGP